MPYLVTNNTNNSRQFTSAQHALTWATEILRVRRFPKICGIYTGEVRAKASGAPDMAGEDAYTQALSIYQCLHKLPQDAQAILTLHVWGDYATPQRLQAAETLQARWRQEGKRVRLSHMYSLRQLAAIFNIHHTTAATRLDKAFTALEDQLGQKDLLTHPHAA